MPSQEGEAGGGSPVLLTGGHPSQRVRLQPGPVRRAKRPGVAGAHTGAPWPSSSVIALPQRRLDNNTKAQPGATVTLPHPTHPHLPSQGVPESPRAMTATPPGEGQDAGGRSGSAETRRWPPSGSYPVPQSTTQGGSEPAMLGTRGARARPLSHPHTCVRLLQANLRSTAAGGPDAPRPPRDVISSWPIRTRASLRPPPPPSLMLAARLFSPHVQPSSGGG